MEFRDGTTMYIIHSEVSLETFDQLDHLNENAVVINGIDGTITLEIDESILKRRLNEYFQRKVTTENQIKVTVADLVLKFRISEIKEIASGIVKPTDNDFFLLIMTLSFTDNDFLVY